jgi:hypothetical protein
MIIKRLKYFSDKDSKLKGGVAGIGSAAILSQVKPSHLTGKVVRYHNTEEKNVGNILEEGVKSKYSKDPKNLTNQRLTDINPKEKEGLVYTSKSKRMADRIGKNRGSKNKTLKLEFDYDEIKSQEKIKNPELRGAKNWKEYLEIRSKKHPEFKDLPKSKIKKAFKALDEETHIFKDDIDSSHIVGGKGYKRRTMKQVGKYIKNNPTRFGKEAAKIGVGASLGAYSIKKLKEKE